MVIATYAGLGTPLWRALATDPFSKATGISAEVFESPLPAASIAQAEGKPQFNLAVVAEYSVPGLIKKGLVELLTPDDIPAIRNVPERLWPRTPDGQLMGMPVYFGLFGIAYNTDLAKPTDFSSWQGLLDPKWKGQISVSRANFLAAYDVQLYARISGGDETHLKPGEDFLRELVPQALNIYSSMASLGSQIQRGEVVAAAFYANEINIMRRNGATEIGIRIPDEGGLITPYLLVMPKGAPNQGAAKRMMNAIVEPSYQAAFSQASLVWPMNDKTPLPEAVRKDLVYSPTEALSRNIALDWWTGGTNLAAETDRVDAMLRDIK